jgi:hypothetical protein
MIVSRTGALRLPRVVWRRDARRSFRALLAFVGASPFGNANLRERQIEEAIESLRHAPLRCEVVDVKGGLTFRRLTVASRFFVYYVYIAPRGITSGGTISIRAVKHAASEKPFLGVRESTDQPLGVLASA